MLSARSGNVMPKFQKSDDNNLAVAAQQSLSEAK